MKRHLPLFLVAIVTLGQPVMARESVPVTRAPFADVIDIPTADIVDHYGYNVSFRFGSEGDVQAKTAFGVFPRLNVGFGLDGEHIIGSENARLNRPTLNVKFQIVKPETKFPALSVGFDGQGYEFDKAIDEYDQREKGLYLVSTSRIFIPELQFHLGANIYDFDEGNSVHGFTGLVWTYESMFSLMTEWDTFDNRPEHRLNYGAKIFITPVFTVDLIGRNVPESPSTDDRETERIVRLNYSGTF